MDENGVVGVDGVVGVVGGDGVVGMVGVDGLAKRGLLLPKN